ncbi:Peroxisomal acyl-coenzyme A oxidase 1 [Cyphellophora attinorum]|uniref:Acyl-coenzyme A oxidase n=1 Tax=Cyphellophora attinorum TaxID=1664694 RepID=A0A0N1HDH3_9EURO|nr:Peroxisomal acyl-coenzyme A oxidase 1 [Phialophora attinorum]KPI42462.1 Peroxisomal acyl-coenzyme A oxidase 1 [Phialophora attinorum]
MGDTRTKTRTRTRTRNIPKQVNETPFGVFLWGGPEKFDRRRDVYNELSTNPMFAKDTGYHTSLARKDAWTKAALQSRELIEIKLRKKWPHRHFMDAIRMTDWFLPVQPQFRIFMSNLERQMSDEQKAIWVPKAERFEIFGCYPQTELGHGSNVSGIETTATFDRLTDEFIINSPTISSTKYWIGGSGIWATHGIVVARLIIDGQNYGNHLFLTQLRDLSTQQLMVGVEIYEMGPKSFQGMLGADTGALRFNHVRIPRSQMLARNAQVERSGNYIKPKNLKHSYGSMVTVRALMAEITGHDLLRAVSTAYHYTTFRKQFRRDREQDAEETTVFDYSSVRHRLLPLLAQGVALVLVGQSINEAYQEYTKQMLGGDTSGLEDLHLQTVGAKVYSTEITGRGVETCRIACGGHGYSGLSGFGRMYAHAINAVTYEGDNYVIGQQVPRAILKHYKNKSEASLPSIAYLSLLRDERTPQPPADLTNPTSWSLRSVQEWALGIRQVNLVREHIEDTSRGRDTSYTTHSLTMAHSDFTYWRGLWKVIDAIANVSFAGPMKSLGLVFSLSILFNPHHPSLTRHLPLTTAQYSALRDAYQSALDGFADNHVATIIDAYGLTEYEMDSALARADQTPYEALLDGAKRSEMSGEKMSTCGL